ncbi:MAG: hypothetical protein QGH60_17635 [Phycisphaerae bacterium]|jgi:phosphoglycerol transferase MdoB-like AlkP superfamily enzyme|nr:hypothetical protein [Phycisphaerae bacterium]
MPRSFEDIRAGWPRRILWAAGVFWIITLINVVLNLLIMIGLAIFSLPLQEWNIRLFVSGIFLFGVAWAAYAVVGESVTGIVRRPGMQATRDERPVLYWMHIGLKMFWALVGLGLVFLMWLV